MTNSPRTPLNRLLKSALGLLALALVPVQAVFGSIAGPYASDANTLFLFHFDEAAGGSVTANAGSTGSKAYSVNLTTASATPPTVTTVIGAAGAYTGFGGAANVNSNGYLIGFDYNNSGAYDADVSGTSLSGDALFLSTSLNMGNGGPTPWTLEALICPTVTNQLQEIICTDSSAASGSRGFQFRLNASGRLELNFINGTASGVADITAPIPADAVNGFVANTWYHVAATYDGTYVRLYWTKVDPSATHANLIGMAAVGVDTGVGYLSGPLCIGGENRAANGEYFRGLLDEVRISSVCRAPNAMLFAGSCDLAASATSIAPASAPIGANVLVSAATAGTAPMANQWLFTANGVTTAIPGATNLTYLIQNVQPSHAGAYSLQVSDSTGILTNQPATLTVIPLAGSSVNIVDFGTAAPVPSANDQSQLATVNMVSGGTAQDGLNYYDNNGSPAGQTFTTGPNPGGYIINGIFLKTAGLNSSGTGSAQTYTLRLYSVSGSTATLLSTYVTANMVGFPDGDWLLYSGGLTNVLKPNSVYAYTHHRNGSSSWDLLAYNNSGSDAYAGGEMCVIPNGGGTIMFGTTHLDDAAFDINLSPTPTTPVLYQQPVSQTVVSGQAASFNVGAWVASPSYQWYTCSDTNYSSPQPVAGATGSSYAIAAAAASDANNYFAVINSSVTSAVATLTVRVSVNSLAWLGSTSYNWDLTTANWSNTVAQTPGAYYQTGDNVMFTDAGKSASTIALNGQLAPTSITVSASSNYVFGGSGSLVANVQLTKNGTGTLTLNNANSFRGATLVNNGVLQLGNANALGAATNTVTVNGGTLDFHGIAALTLRQYNIQGSGYTNAGALANFGNGIQNANGVLGVNLLGDATISANNRWDLNGDGGGPGLQGNHHNLTKTGPGDIFFINAGANNQLADITILRGTLGFQGTNNLGDPDKTISALGGTLGFYAVANGGLDVNGVGLTKNLVLSNAFFNNSGGSVTLNAPTTLLGTNTISAGWQETSDMAITFNSPLSGAGGLVINSIQQVFFNGANTYSGPTIINTAAKLTLGQNSSLNSSSLIQLGNASTILDLSSTPGLVLGSGQTLAGLGTLYGNVTANAGSTVSPGLNGLGTLTLSSGNLTLSGATLPIELGGDASQVGNGVNDLVTVLGSLVLSGQTTIQISPVAPLSSGTYTVLNYYGSLTGGAANLKVVSSNPRYTFTLVNPANTPGSIQIAVSGVAVPLVWKGGKAPSPNVWNHTATNWLNSGTGLFDQFYNGDMVTFDDSAVTNVVNVTETNSPGLMTLANNTLAYTFLNADNLRGTLDKEGSGAVTLMTSSNALALTAITNNAGTLVLNPGADTTLAAPLVDNGAGAGTFIKAGTNLLTLSGDNSAYTGAMVVTNGTLRYSALTALGAATTVYATNGGSLDINNRDTGTKSLAIAGMGYNGQGALTCVTTAWGAWPYEFVHNVTLLGDAAIGANNRWDLNNGTLTGNGHNLTKVGGGQITLKTIGETGLGNIDIVAGNLTFQDTATMGDPARTVTVRSNATLAFWAGAGAYNKANVTLINGSIDSGGAANTLNSTVTLQPGTNTFTGGADLTVQGAVVGAGGFTKSGAGILYLNGNNTYSGPTLIGGNSTVNVGANSSLGTSSTIEIDGGSTLDVTAPAAFNLGAGQTLIGNGTLAGGNVTFGNGATLSVGFPGSTATLTARGSLTFQAGSTNVVDVNKTTSLSNDTVTGLTSVTLGGTLVLNNLGNALAAGDALPLFNATRYSGSFATIIPATPGAGLLWDTSGLTNGTLRVVAAVLPQIGGATLSSGSFVFSGSGGTAGATYSVLAQTNVAQPLANWTLVGTGTFDSTGKFAFTNAVSADSAKQFYLIRTP